MKRFKFLVSETLSREVEVQAENETKARMKLEDAYASGDMVLMAEDFVPGSMDIVLAEAENIVPDEVLDTQGAGAIEQSRKKRYRVTYRDMEQADPGTIEVEARSIEEVRQLDLDGEIDVGALEYEESAGPRQAYLEIESIEEIDSKEEAGQC